MCSTHEHLCTCGSGGTSVCLYMYVYVSTAKATDTDAQAQESTQPGPYPFYDCDERRSRHTFLENFSNLSMSAFVPDACVRGRESIMKGTPTGRVTAPEKVKRSPLDSVSEYDTCCVLVGHITGGTVVKRKLKETVYKIQTWHTEQQRHRHTLKQTAKQERTSTNRSKMLTSLRDKRTTYNKGKPTSEARHPHVHAMIISPVRTNVEMDTFFRYVSPVTFLISCCVEFNFSLLVDTAASLSLCLFVSDTRPLFVSSLQLLLQHVRVGEAHRPILQCTLGINPDREGRSACGSSSHCFTCFLPSFAALASSIPSSEMFPF